MADSKASEPGTADVAVTPALDSSETASSDALNKDGNLTFAHRGQQVDGSSSHNDIDGYDAERMRDRALLTAKEEKALMRRVDWRIMSICSILFLLKNIDADNISNARIMNKDTNTNIMTELNMTSDQYNLLSVLYYVSLLALVFLSNNEKMNSGLSDYQIPYIVFEAPSNLLLKKFSPSTWQSRIMVSWGIALICHVAVSNKEGIYTTRFFLGLV